MSRFVIILLMKSLGELLTVLETVLLQVLLQLHVNLLYLAKVFDEGEHVILPDASDRLVSSEVRLAPLTMFVALAPQA